MMKVFARLYADEIGSILSAEAVMLASIGVVGVVAGIGSMTTAVNSELNEVGAAFRSLDQSYKVNGYTTSYSGFGPGGRSSVQATAVSRGSQYQGVDPQVAVDQLQIQFLENSGASARMIGRQDSFVRQMEGGVTAARTFESDAASQELLQTVARMRLELDALKAAPQQNLGAPRSVPADGF